MHWCFVCTDVYLCEGARSPGPGVIDSWEMPVWVLGIEPRSFRRASSASALNHWAISPTQDNGSLGRITLPSSLNHLFFPLSCPFSIENTENHTLQKASCWWNFSSACSVQYKQHVQSSYASYYKHFSCLATARKKWNVAIWSIHPEEMADGKEKERKQMGGERRRKGRWGSACH